MGDLMLKLVLYTPEGGSVVLGYGHTLEELDVLDQLWSDAFQWWERCQEMGYISGFKHSLEAVFLLYQTFETDLRMFAEDEQGNKINPERYNYRGE